MESPRKTLSSEENWTLTKHAYNKLLTNTKRTNTRIGVNSKFGSVYLLNTGNGKPRFVLKRIIFGYPGNSGYNARRHIFETEVKVGSMNISRVGPRVSAYKKTPTYGEYIMNNVRLGNPKAKIFHFSQIKNQIIRNPNSIKLVQNAINNFHRITKGQHGDLHGGNILLVQFEKSTYVMIIDYGAFRTNNEVLNKKNCGRKRLRLKQA